MYNLVQAHLDTFHSTNTFHGNGTLLRVTHRSERLLIPGPDEGSTLSILQASQVSPAGGGREDDPIHEHW